MHLRNFALAFAVVSVSTAATAGADIFMVIPGVPGESQSDTYPKAIEVTSLSVEVADRSCKGVVVEKYVDKSSPILSAAAILGGGYPTVTLHVTKSSDSVMIEYLTYTLSNVVVKAIEQSGGSGDRFKETTTLAPDMITLIYRPQNSKGGFDSPIQYSLNCPKYK